MTWPLLVDKPDSDSKTDSTPNNCSMLWKLYVFEVCGICLQASRVEKHRVRLGCELERKRLNYQKRQERTGKKRRRKGVNVPSPLLKVPWWLCLADDRSTPQPRALSLSCTSRHTRERTYTPISHCTESGPSLEVAFRMNAAPTTSRRPCGFPFYSVSFCVILAPR